MSDRVTNAQAIACLSAGIPARARELLDAAEPTRTGRMSGDAEIITLSDGSVITITPETVLTEAVKCNPP